MYGIQYLYHQQEFQWRGCIFPEVRLIGPDVQLEGETWLLHILIPAIILIGRHDVFSGQLKTRACFVHGFSSAWKPNAKTLPDHLNIEQDNHRRLVPKNRHVMSGVEALAALGLVCNIMQVISFARETAEICSTVFQTGSVDPSLTTTVAHLTKAFGELDISLASAPAPLTSDDDELWAIAKACLATAKKLDDEVRKVSSANSKGNHARAVLVGLKTKLQGKIEKMEKSLAAHQGTLQTRLLLQI